MFENQNSADADTTAQQGQQADPSATQQQSQPAGGSERTYTFDELNAHTDRVVKERIDKQNEKHAKEIAAKDAELKKADDQIKDLSERLGQFEASKARGDLLSKVATATGVSEEQLALLKGDTEEELMASATAFKSSLPSLYPAVPEGGDPGLSKTSKEDILAIKSTEERIAAMGRNRELFK